MELMTFKNYPNHPTIIIDAGHGGLRSDGQYFTYPHKRHEFEIDGQPTQVNEGVLNRAVAYGLSFQLDYIGIKNYVLTANDDMSLSRRSTLVNKRHPDKNALLISIHHNWFDNYKVHGAEFFTYDGIAPISDKVGQAAGQLFIETFNHARKLRITGNSINPSSDNLVLFKKANFHILRETKVPSILTEFGFMSNPTEYKYISSAKGINDQIQFLRKLCIHVIENNLITL